jgi:UDP-GlcNAc3NAcA epimerase
MILTVVGARPQFVKAAVVSKAFHDSGIEEQIVHTGQHYDLKMSEIFWEELNIPSPFLNLNIGSGSHGHQTGKMMIDLESAVLSLETRPSHILVYGDTNSTLAAALVGSKLHIPIIHVEAGLRSYNREMPEEINRVLTDHISELLFCSSEEGVRNLKQEGIGKGVHVVGDVMFDAIRTFSAFAKDKNSSFMDAFRDQYFSLCTIHRPANTDNSEHLTSILSAFAEIEEPILWPVHPRVKSRLKDLDIPENVIISEPLSYFEMLLALKNCSRVFTDSGGLQKEAYWMKKPCITLRDETEWVETLEGGWNQLVGHDRTAILQASRKKPKTDWKPIYGDGKASKRIAEIILSSV